MGYIMFGSLTCLPCTIAEDGLAIHGDVLGECIYERVFHELFNIRGELSGINNHYIDKNLINWWLYIV